MSRRNISERTQQRKLHPQRGDQPSIGLLDSNTNTTKSQPAERGKPCTWRMLGSLGTWGFCSFLFSRFSISPLLGSNPVPLTSFHGPGKAALAHHAPYLFGTRTQGKQKGFSEWIIAGGTGSHGSYRECPALGLVFSCQE